MDIFRNRLKSPAIKRKVVEDSELPGTSKRINVEGGEESAKLSRRQYVELCEKRELEDDEGLEKSYQANFCGLGHIPLKNIEIPPQLQNLIDSSAERIEFDCFILYHMYDTCHFFMLPSLLLPYFFIRLLPDIE